MTNEMNSPKAKLTPGFWVLTLMVFVAAFVRLLPHPPNFAPIAAMALFGGAYFSKKSFAFIIPLVALFLSDVVIGLFKLCINCCTWNCNAKESKHKEFNLCFYYCFSKFFCNYKLWSLGTWNIVSQNS